MSNTDFSRFTKHVVQYFWDPPARNEDDADIWCLGRRYDSRYLDARQSKVISTSPSAQSDSDASPADSAVVTVDPQKPEETAENGRDDLANSRATLSVSEEEALGWPADFLDDMEARIWLSYRSGFPPIARSNDPSVSSAMSFSTKLRNLGAQGGFTSDTGWGCMIRSGQSLLANSLALLQLGRDWRVGQREQEHMELLSLFADTPEAPFSIHKFVEHGAQACGKHPGEWFGPSATARSLQALTDKYPLANLRVYARPDDSDVYAESVLATATQKHPDDVFEPTLIVLGVRLGIDRITPVYHAALKAALAMPQSVGIAGGRPSSSHYFTGYQGEQFFYLDPHTTRPALLPSTSSSAEAEAGQQKGLSGEDVRTCHTRRVRRLRITEMDPSMLLGFLVRSREEFEEWRRGVEGVVGKAIVHVHEREPRYATGVERAGAVDEVETWDDGTEGEGEGEEEEDGEGDES
ncbi:Cysteine protease atg4 [Friedmanniomyces endolithicus]|uniref:Cysteine protease n=1 Tax=Friedmanniomyces endolithicus TaxID=329885 RepID=A0AAN6K6T0_9PEZI|nr:Cysteine protease atg4 [Friedmanniomyces endolithicus]KAK0787059.1 Cysteine protease atg4 [Friedmanniomyces endolithicus]KAK0804521.1 Cysteine protease atg4 [Friedmanniomyces endolithicus]KAK0870350.1 Cysteine protease atg4 [Friedmanniomyces endolithicus]KAK0894186.1 Cysteine protease atg4 [Friedmanniomyces endolithicus]